MPEIRRNYAKKSSMLNSKYVNTLKHEKNEKIKSLPSVTKLRNEKKTNRSPNIDTLKLKSIANI